MQARGRCLVAAYLLACLREGATRVKEGKGNESPPSRLNRALATPTSGPNGPNQAMEEEETHGGRELRAFAGSVRSNAGKGGNGG